MTLKENCPVCNSKNIVDFYQVEQIPVQSVVLLHNLENALNFPKGNLILSYCMDCAFVFNRAYQPELVDYRLENESTQRFSGTFNTFEKKLAEDLIKRFSLTNKTILEIGCGQGEFLEMLCVNHRNSGIGFDPAFHSYLQPDSTKPIKVIPDYYSQQYQHIPADFFCCKMTLEHIHDPVPLLKAINKAVKNTQHPADIFFQIPESGRIFSEFAFWDIYYEHCSYFTPASLRTLFNNQSFEIFDLWTDYEDQYLMISSKLPGKINSELNSTPSIKNTLSLIDSFKKNITGIFNQWKSFFEKNADKTIVIWGAGSKCVAFCTTLGLRDEITCAVDINPHKMNTFLPGTGHKVFHPEKLSEINPHIVIMMNPIYEKEIKNLCTRFSICPEFIKITDFNHELPNL